MTADPRTRAFRQTPQANHSRCHRLDRPLDRGGDPRRSRRLRDRRGRGRPRREESGPGRAVAGREIRGDRRVAAYAELKAELAGTNIAAAAGAGSDEGSRRMESADLVVGAIAGRGGRRADLCRRRGGARRGARQQGMSASAPASRSCARRGRWVSTSCRWIPSTTPFSRRSAGKAPEKIEKMWLTASGGPFRTGAPNRSPPPRRSRRSPIPNWAMGAEGDRRFRQPDEQGTRTDRGHAYFRHRCEKLDVLVHPQSIVHGLVSFADGAVTAGMAMPDMKVPIAHCLGLARPASPPRRAVSISPKSAR